MRDARALSDDATLELRHIAAVCIYAPILTNAPPAVGTLQIEMVTG